MIDNWYDLICMEMQERDEKFEDIICSSLSDAEWHKKFGSWDGITAKPFLAWTQNRVYFSVEYDSMYGVESVPRNPSLDDSEEIEHATGKLE